MKVVKVEKIDRRGSGSGKEWTVNRSRQKWKIENRIQ